MNAETKLIYGNYNRKSTESEDRQILSLGSQIEEAKKMADGLKVKVSSDNTFTEAKSAKTAFKRPQFERMFSLIEKGVINAIITWHPDRLSRNSIDGARLIEQMDKGNLIEIVTASQTYRNTPMDKFMFMFQCMQAKLDNDNKGINVKRGLHTKAGLGMYPAPAPVGYKNDKYAEKGNKVPQPDDERFPIVRKMINEMLAGKHQTVAEFFRVVRNEWNFTMPNGKKISRATFYRIFSNPFMYGKYEYPQGSGKWYDGIHQPMMSEEEYDKLQFILGKKGKPRPKTHIFDFTGMMHCGECGASITAELKIKKQKNGNIHRYVYYHCTRRINPNCSQGAIREPELKKQIIAEIESIEIPVEFHSYAMKWFKKENEKEATSRNTIVDSQQRAYKGVIAKIDGLMDMRATGEISAEEFAEKKQRLLDEKKNLEKVFEDTGKRVDKWVETGDRMFDFIENAKYKFEKGSPEVKRSILSTLGSDLVLKDKILNIDIEKSLFPLKRVSKTLTDIKKRLEPIKNQDKQREFDRLCNQNLVVRCLLDKVRKYFELNPDDESGDSDK